VENRKKKTGPWSLGAPIAANGRGGLEAEQSLALEAPNGGCKHGSSAGMEVRGNVTIAWHGQRRRGCHWAGPGTHNTFLIIQIFANPFEFEMVKYGLLLPKKFQIKYVCVEK
jgi:hypothetical protein